LTDRSAAEGFPNPREGNPNPREGKSKETEANSNQAEGKSKAIFLPPIETFQWLNSRIQDPDPLDRRAAIQQSIEVKQRDGPAFLVRPDGDPGSEDRSHHRMSF
jgi:hypothetical protein